MKKIISLILVVVTILCVTSFSVSAHSVNEVSNEKVISQATQRLEDGTLLEITVSEEVNDIMLLADTYTKTGYKTYTFKNNDGDTLWWFKLTGKYSVTTGTSATCTSATYSYSISNDNWSFKSASTSKSGNKALADAAFTRKVLFITIETKEITLGLTCDKNGNLS